MHATVILQKSTRADKKFMAIITGPKGKKVVHFGAAGYSDFTKHKDEDRKLRYINRHKARENWNDPYTAGFYARWILWNKPTLDTSIKDTEKRFKIKITKK